MTNTMVKYYDLPSREAFLSYFLRDKVWGTMKSFLMFPTLSLAARYEPGHELLAPLSLLPSWMESLPPSLRRVPLSHLVIPGSHDCGAFGLKIAYGLAPDKQSFKKRWWFKYFPRLALLITKRWSKTQSADIRDQLEHGVRYFDLRAAPRLVDPCLRATSVSRMCYDEGTFFVHGLYGPNINTMLQDVKDFLSSHPKEVVILHFQHCFGPTTEEAIVPKLMDLFKGKMLPFDPTVGVKEFPSLEQMDNKGYQVIVFFPSDCKTVNPLIWPGTYIPNPWANTYYTKTLIPFLQENIATRCQNKLFVTQGVLTPDDAYVTKNVWTSLELNLCIPCNKRLDTFLDNYGPGPRGPNIVMSDFVQWNNYHIPRKIIGLNLKQIN